MAIKAAFDQVSAADITSASSPVCMDDQWFPSHDLRRKGVLRGAQSTKRAVAEFKRSLLSSQTILVNRSYLVNSDAIRTLLVTPEDRGGLERLFARHDVIAFLLDDTSPELDAAKRRGTVDDARLSAWHEVLDTTRIACARLSWQDEETNRDLIRERITARFAARLVSFAATGAPVLERLSGGAPLEACREYLTTKFAAELSRQLDECGEISRSGLYRKLVMAEGRDLGDSVVDHRKPFACDIKEAIDLIYNTTLTDATGVQPLTPAGSPSRDYLSEDGDIGAQISAGDAAALVGALAKLLGTQATIDRYARLLDALSLETIRQIRSTEVWQDHIAAATRLARLPIGRNGGSLLVEEISDAVALARDRSETLGQLIISRYLKDWPKSSGLAARGYRFGVNAIYGGVAAGAIGAVGSFSASAGMDLATIGEIAGFGALASQALDDLKGFGLGKVRQQIDMRIGLGSSLVDACLPRLELGDPGETIDHVVALLERKNPALAGIVNAAGAEAAVVGHQSSLSVPQYG